MKRKDFIKMIKSMPRKCEVLVEGAEPDLTLTFDSTTQQWTVNLKKLENSNLTNSKK